MTSSTYSLLSTDPGISDILRGTGNMEMSCAFLITARSSALALGFSVPVR